MKRRSQISVPVAHRRAVEFFLNQRWLKLMALLAFAVAVAGFGPGVQAQRVQYVKGVLAPTQIKEGDLLKIGDPLITAANGRIILAYGWKTVNDAFPCEAYWIMNGGIKSKVPDLRKPSTANIGGHPTNCGAATVDGIKAALSEKATGINIIAFSGLPGKGGGNSSDVFSRGAQVLKPLDNAIYQGLRQLPRSFSGKITSVTEGRVAITAGSKDVFEGTTTNETQVQGAESLQALIGADAYVEYVTAPPNRIRMIIPTNSPHFYKYLGFHEEQPYTGDCASLPQGKTCLKFADGFVWLVDEQAAPALNNSQAQYGLTLESFSSDAAQYLHIAGTQFVNKISSGAN